MFLEYKIKNLGGRRLKLKIFHDENQLFAGS